MSTELTVAVLGTGAMGAPMAANIARAGMGLRVWDRTRAKAEELGGAGVTVCDTPAEAASGADLVLTMLFDAEAVAAAVEGDTGALGAMGASTVWLQCATVGTAGCEHLADL